MERLYEAKRLLRYSVIRTGLNAISALNLSRLCPAAAKNGMIFTLHQVRPADLDQKFSPNAILSVTPEFLEATIKTVLKAGMIPVHVHDLPELLTRNSEQRRYICFTLDDGYRNNMIYAAPIFERYNIPYTIFITSGYAERKNILWWETVETLLRPVNELSFDFGSGHEALALRSTPQKLAAFSKFAQYVDHIDEDFAVQQIADLARNSGLDPLDLTEKLIMDAADLRELAQGAGKNGLVHFGAHSVSHINFNRAHPNRIDLEVKNSVAWVKNNLNQQPKSFAYPYGWKNAVSDYACQAVQQANLKIGVTTQAGMISPQCLVRKNAFPRTSLNGFFQKQSYVKALLSGIPFIYQY